MRTTRGLAGAATVLVTGAALRTVGAEATRDAEDPPGSEASRDPPIGDERPLRVIGATSAKPVDETSRRSILMTLLIAAGTGRSPSIKAAMSSSVALARHMRTRKRN